MERVAFEAHGLIFIWYICILGNNPSQRSCFLHHPVGDLIEIIFFEQDLIKLQRHASLLRLPNRSR